MNRDLLSYCMALALVAVPMAAGAEEWPARPIRFLVGFAPGGTTDIIARKLAPSLGAALGTNIVVENRSGASGMIASGELARAAPDGHTIAMVISSNVSVPAIGRKLPFDPIGSFSPVTLVGKVPLAFTIGEKVPASTLAEFVTLARQKPGEFTYSSPGIGLAHHFAGALFNLQAGISMIHVPYAGAAPALADVIGGQVASTFAAVPTVAPSLAGGRARALGLSGKEVAPRLPKVATIAASGYPDYEITEWYGITAPAGTPQRIVDRLNVEINRLLCTPEWQQWLDENEVIRPTDRSAKSFQTFISSEALKFEKIAIAAKIREGQ